MLKISVIALTSQASMSRCSDDTILQPHGYMANAIILIRILRSLLSKLKISRQARIE